ncbi:MAG: (2Fe-2S)-binding protein [Candidatus Rokubacteria bacterium]|nr:(2Fe-2S)-binding protein [Candidatus Rokubacteria bacterium]
MTKRALTLTINGESHEVLAAPQRTLLDVLRTDLGLTGTKENCLEAECGVCTVLLDGLAVNACILLAVQCQGRAIVTIEGLAAPGIGTQAAHAGGAMHPLQRAFIEHGAVQCGYCIPGMILSAKAYLDEHPEPTEDEVREALAGNLCRCTGYQKIADAVMSAARDMRGAGAEAAR